MVFASINRFLAHVCFSSPGMEFGRRLRSALPRSLLSNLLHAKEMTFD